VSFEKVVLADGRAVLYRGDCLEVLPTLGNVDAVVTDPPYGETSLTWDAAVRGWTAWAPTRSLWCFGSMRFFMANAAEFDGWKFAQDVVWQKHNGSNFHADRFRRIHENVLQFYRGDWATIYKEPVTTNDATKRTVRAKARPPHTGHIERIPYVSEDGGPRLQRSVIEARSCHGFAVHPTQKPVEIIKPLVQYSVPPCGAVLDPFTGSGSVGVAAVRLGRRFIGIEINPAYFDIACRRIEAAADLGLFAEVVKEKTGELFTEAGA
jgi:site-specific DNA-methyltransferase (adenine-specific)